MNVRLIVDKGGQRKVVSIRHDQAVIGRSHGNAVRIPSAEVSRQHCRLVKTAGLVMIHDLGSVNGTLLNGQRIEAGEIVRPGDRVQVGPVTFVVEYELTSEALDNLRNLDGERDVLEGVAEVELAEVEEVEFDAVLPFELVEQLDEVEVVDEVELPTKKPPKLPANPFDDLAPLSADFELDADTWHLPEGALDGTADVKPKKPNQ